MQHIQRKWNGMPTVFTSSIEKDCIFKNTLIGIASLIIDKEFIDEMNSIADQLKEMPSLLTNINNKIWVSKEVQKNLMKNQ